MVVDDASSDGHSADIFPADSQSSVINDPIGVCEGDRSHRGASRRGVATHRFSLWYCQLQGVGGGGAMVHHCGGWGDDSPGWGWGVGTWFTIEALAWKSRGSFEHIQLKNLVLQLTWKVFTSVCEAPESPEARNLGGDSGLLLHVLIHSSVRKSNTKNWRNQRQQGRTLNRS